MTPWPFFRLSRNPGQDHTKIKYLRTQSLSFSRRNLSFKMNSPSGMILKLYKMRTTTYTHTFMLLWPLENATCLPVFPPTNLRWTGNEHAAVIRKHSPIFVLVLNLTIMHNRGGVRGWGGGEDLGEGGENSIVYCVGLPSYYLGKSTMGREKRLSKTSIADFPRDKHISEEILLYNQFSGQ